MLEAIDEVVENLHIAENSDIKDKSVVDIEEMIASDAVEQPSLNDRDDNQEKVGENMVQKPKSDFVIDELQPCDKTNHSLDDKHDKVGEDMQGEECQIDEVESDRIGLMMVMFSLCTLERVAVRIYLALKGVILIN